EGARSGAPTGTGLSDCVTARGPETLPGRPPRVGPARDAGIRGPRYDVVVSSSRRPAAALAFASIAMLGVGAGCDGDAIVVGVESATACEVPSYTSPSSVDRIDLV